MLNMKVLFACGTALMFAACANPDPPTTFPKIDRSSAQSILVVAKRLDADYLKDAVACGNSKPIEGHVMVCMDPPPTWFLAETVVTVFGKPMPPEFYAATTSHYGPEFTGPDDPPELIYLWSDGTSFLMPRYERRGLVQNIGGEYYLIVEHSISTSFLPCSVKSLYEPIDYDNFMGNLELSRTRFEQYVSKDDKDLYRLTEKGAVPLYAISISRLKAYLEKNPPDTNDLHCKSS